MYEMNDRIDALIGNTPILRLKKIEEKYALEAKLFAKLEYFNPGGSIKDRVAKAMIDEAEKTGALKAGGSIIEATSGNTGIGLALVAAARGYKAVIVMPDTMSVERQKLMKAYGAELVLTDGKKGMSGAVEKAEEILKNTPNAIIAGQFDNPANPKAHYETTGPEIFTQTKGEVDIFVAGIGTGGTLSGTGKYLKEQKSSIQVVGIEPASSPLLSKGVAGAHAIQGIGANFVPKNYDSSVCDEIVTVENQAAIDAAREVGQTEGAFVGISSGAALWAAIEVGKRPENEGKTIVVILPDGGDRYLSTALVE
ncbi:MAG: cysteine synthase A [Clostridia bacterium]|nr:cysteine synthase A [Clostridia bacterium]